MSRFLDPNSPVAPYYCLSKGVYPVLCVTLPSLPCVPFDRVDCTLPGRLVSRENLMVYEMGW